MFVILEEEISGASTRSESRKIFMNLLLCPRFKAIPTATLASNAIIIFYDPHVSYYQRAKNGEKFTHW